MFALAITSILVISCTTAGVMLIVRSERLSTIHQCLQCGYNLQGLPGSSRCPECGAELDGTNTIVPGQWRTREWRLALGLVLLCLGGFGLLWSTWLLLLIALYGW